MNCAELLSSYVAVYDTCLRRCGAAKPAGLAEAVDCLVDCMKVAEGVKRRYLEGGCDPALLPI